MSELIDIVFDKVLVYVARHDFVITAGELEEDEVTVRTRERLGQRRDNVLAAKQGLEQLRDTVERWQSGGKGDGGGGFNFGGGGDFGGGKGGPSGVPISTAASAQANPFASFL